MATGTASGTPVASATISAPRVPGLFKVEVVRQFPEPAALVADGQQFRRGVVAWIADAVSWFPALTVGTHGGHRARGAVPRTEREFPVRQVRIAQPLMRPGPD